MTRAVIVPFFKYQPSQRNVYKALERCFLKCLSIWAKEIDHLYIIDSGWNVDISAFNQKIRTTVFRSPVNSHWDNLNMFVPQISEDFFLTIDNDTIIYQEGTVDAIFSKLASNDICSMTDNSGGMQLDKAFSFLQANQYRDTRQRFTPYLFACRNSFFQQIAPYDFTPLPQPVWSDSMGQISKQLLTLQPRIAELPDDRSTLYFLNPKEFGSTPFLDSYTYEWSKDCPKKYGYYHIRNFSGGVYLVETRTTDKNSYHRAQSIMPRQEAFRLLAWLWYINDQVQGDIISIVQDYHVQPKDFQEYLDAFLDFHSYLRRIL